MMRPHPRDVHFAVPFQICWHYSNGRECRPSCKFAHGEEELALWTTQRQAGRYDLEESLKSDFDFSVTQCNYYVTTIKNTEDRQIKCLLTVNSLLFHPGFRIIANAI